MRTGGTALVSEEKFLDTVDQRKRSESDGSVFKSSGLATALCETYWYVVLGAATHPHSRNCSLCMSTAASMSALGRPES